MIRPATPSDIHYIIALADNALRETPRRYPEIDTKRIYDMAAKWFFHWDLCCAFVMEKDNNIVGYIIGLICDYVWSQEKIAMCQSVYVLPKYRGHGVWLIKAFMKWAKERKADKVQLCVAFGVNDGQTEKLMELLGFEEHGKVYSKGYHA